MASIENSLTNALNSRLGVAASIPIAKHHQSLKFGYSHGVYTQFSCDFQNVSVAWQHGWKDPTEESFFLGDDYSEQAVDLDGLTTFEFGTRHQRVPGVRSQNW